MRGNMFIAWEVRCSWIGWQPCVWLFFRVKRVLHIWLVMKKDPKLKLN